MSQSFAYLSFLWHSFLYISLLKVYVEVINTASILFALLFYVFHTRLEQAWAHLIAGKVSFFSELRLRLHLRYTVDSLHFLADFNRLYGSQLFAFLLVLFPENATMWMMFLLGRGHLSPVFRLFVFTFAFCTILFATTIHYKAIRLTARMTDSGKYLTVVAARSKGITGLRWRIKLDRYIDLFHSQTRPHTVSYGRHGNVTSTSFSRVRQKRLKVILE